MENKYKVGDQIGALIGTSIIPCQIDEVIDDETLIVILPKVIYSNWLGYNTNRAKVTLTKVFWGTLI